MNWTEREERIRDMCVGVGSSIHWVWEDILGPCEGGLEKRPCFFFVVVVFVFLFIYLHVHTLFGSFLHPALLPHPSPHPQFQAWSVPPLSLILLKKGHKHNKKDKVFLLVELRIAIQKDSYYRFHVPMCYDPCWFNSNWSLLWFLIPCSW
jgi:hypothetical protein